MTMRADTCETSQGTIVAPYYVQESEDWVQVLAFNSAKQVLVTWQYRHGDGKIYSEIPCGCIDADETPLQAAKRELVEETGCVAEQYIALPPFSPNSARQNNRVHSFIALETHLKQATSFDEAEEIESKFVSMEQLLSWIASGEFSQGLHIGTLFLAFQHLDWLEIR